MQSRMAYPAAILIPLLCSELRTTEGGVHIGCVVSCTTICSGSTKHIRTAPSMQAQHYTFTNVITPSKHSTVWCCHTMYLNVATFTDIIHFLQSHLHTHKVDIQDCHQASDNCHWPYMVNRNWYESNRCTRFRWWEPCEQQEPWEMRQTPSYVGLQLQLALLYWVPSAYKLIVLSVQASRIFSGRGLCKKCFTPRH